MKEPKGIKYSTEMQPKRQGMKLKAQQTPGMAGNQGGKGPMEWAGREKVTR